jgi:hypothetical protein
MERTRQPVVKRLFERPWWPVQRLRQFVRQRRISAETSLRIDSYVSTMDKERPSATATDINMDRRIIRVDIPPAHAGVTAALRRAFSPVNDDDCDQDFSDLLRRLN